VSFLGQINFESVNKTEF